MRRLLLIIALIFSSLGAPSANSNAADFKPVEVVEWNLEFEAVILEETGLHSDLKARIPWYSQEYASWPLSVRYPKKVYFENTKEDEICLSLPLQIRKEISDVFILDKNNQIEMVFTPKIIFQKNNVTFRNADLRIGPNDWVPDKLILNKNLNFCLTRGQMDSNPVIAILLQFSLKYSRLFSDFNTPKNLCDDIDHGSCIYVNSYGGGIDVTQEKYLVVNEAKNYETKIAELKTYLGFPPCPVSRKCELAKRNLAFLESDLANSRERQQAVELKAKQDAEALAAAELKAKQEAEAKVLSDSAKESRVQALKDSGQYYQERTSCHSNSIVARLQSNRSGTWVDVANVEGWVSLNSSCFQPWTGYRAEKGELVRWRLASPGSWEVFTTPITETTSTKEAENLAAELNAKREAEAKEAAELKPLQDAQLKAAELAAAKKMKTITCTKGKITKKITSIKPACPKGYKKK